MRLDWVNGRVEMSHGSGGRASAELIEQLFLPTFDNPLLAAGNDFAALPSAGGSLVMSCDSHVIAPLFFPGGDIGSLAVHGTVNDIAMAGAVPRWLSAGFILEEGLPLADLKRIVESMARAAREAGVVIACGDTKVVERGKGDGLFITTTGLGERPAGVDIRGDRAEPGDAILVSGPIGDHGIAVMAQREGLQFETSIRSDSAALHTLVAAMLERVPSIHTLRDPTRGGLATSLNEIARQSGVDMIIDEHTIPMRAEVAAACELLGLDPLYVANEGRLIAICPRAQADHLLGAMRAHPLGREAAIIGSVRKGAAGVDGRVELQTRYGGRRVVDWLSGEQLPRIC